MYDEVGNQKSDSKDDGEGKKHKEEGEVRRKLDEADRRKIAEELEKYSHPLNDHQSVLYNICNGQVATDSVNVHNALAIGNEHSREFSAFLCSEFHKAMKKRVKTMELLKKPATIKGKTGNALAMKLLRRSTKLVKQ